MVRCLDLARTVLHHIRNYFLPFGLKCGCFISENKTSMMVLKWSDLEGGLIIIILI